jgi:uncharacterized protein YqgC (DUF456 family)
MTVLAVTVFFVSFLMGMVLIPLGLPGLWVILLGLLGYGALTEFHTVGLPTLILATGLAFLGEIVEWRVGFGYAKKYGGSRRAGWGALLGGLVGAVAGLPIPVVGSVVGSFLGSFAGAAVFEFTRSPGTAIGAGWGALLGRVVGTAAKTALGFVIGVMGLVAVLRNF